MTVVKWASFVSSRKVQTRLNRLFDETPAERAGWCWLSFR
jgi:hypothetical protein